MSAFIAAGANTEDTIISNDEFFPAVDPNLVRSLMRLDNSVTNPRIRQALIDAMGKTNTDLAAWQTTQQNQGNADLSNVAAPQIDGKTRHEHDYQRAVYCQAKAEITERYQDYDTTAAGTSHAEEIENSIDDYKRQARFAIRRILGQSQSTIELI